MAVRISRDRRLNTVYNDDVSVTLVTKAHLYKEHSMKARYTNILIIIIIIIIIKLNWKSIFGGRNSVLLVETTTNFFSGLLF